MNEERTQDARIDLRGLFEEEQEPLFLFTPDTLEIKGVNIAARRRYGYSREEFLAMTIKNLRPPEDVERFISSLRKSQQESTHGPSRFPGVWRHRKKDGTIFDVEITRLRLTVDARPMVLVMARDVSVQEKRDQELRSLGELWRSLVELSPDTIFMIDADDRISFVNRLPESVPREAIVGHKAHELAPEEERAKVTRNLATVRESKKAVHDEMRGLRSDGIVHWYESRWIPLEHAGEGKSVLNITTDVTARHRAEEAMRASEERFRAMLENTNDAIALLAADGTILYGSPAVPDLHSFTVDALVGRSAFSFIHPEDVPRVRATFAAILEVPGRTRLTEFRARKGKGWFWTEGRATNLLDNPNVRAIVASYRDITGRKEADAALRESEERHRLLFDQSPLPIFLYDVETRRLLGANDSAVRLYGHARDALMTMTIDDLVAPEGGGAQTPSAGGDEQVPARHRKKDGSVIDVEVTSHAISLGARSARLVVAQDVTDRKRLEAQLRQSQKMEAVGLLAGGIAHDFNNLLGIILASAEMAERTGQAQPSSLEEVVSAASRAAQLTRKLLAFSRKQVLHVRTLDLNDALDDFTRLLTRVVGEDVELAITKRCGPLVVKADAGQIEQVLLNLCTNARQAMPKGGKLAIDTARVTLDAAFVAQNPWAHVGDFAEIRVKDSGVGMDESTRSHAFEPFFTTKPEGTGLGLATVYGIVQQHHGCLDVESAPLHGTTVRVLLPLTEGIAKMADPSREEVLERGTETLLLAEDEAPLRRILARTLEELGYKVIAAADGEQAFAAFESTPHTFDLVILDVVMPKLGGPESFARMSALRPGLKVIFTTGYAPNGAHVNDLVERDGHIVLGKPFTLHELARKVREVLAGNRENSRQEGTKARRAFP